MGGKPFPGVDPDRRRLMSGIGRKNTSPEVLVRKAMHRAGLRFRLHRHDLPGTPDIVLPSRKVAVFVHGCFWHRHDCKAGRLPKTRTEYWEAKFVRNVERDRCVQAALERAGWVVLVIWECEAKRGDNIACLIHKITALPAPGKRTKKERLGCGPKP